jgi:hypothetical protein
MIIVDHPHTLVVEADDKRASLYENNLRDYPGSRTERVRTYHDAIRVLRKSPDINQVCISGALCHPLDALKWLRMLSEPTQSETQLFGRRNSKNARIGSKNITRTSI